MFVWDVVFLAVSNKYHYCFLFLGPSVGKIPARAFVVYINLGAPLREAAWKVHAACTITHKRITEFISTTYWLLVWLEFCWCRSQICSPFQFRIWEWSLYLSFIYKCTITHNKESPKLIPIPFQSGNSSTEINEHDSPQHFGKVDRGIR